MRRRRLPPGSPPSEQLGFELPPRRLGVPETSRRARRGTTRAQARRTLIQDAIVACLDPAFTRGVPAPALTASELHAAIGAQFGVDLYEIRRRVSDLHAAGVLTASPRRGTTSLGGTETAWVLAPGVVAGGDR